MGFHVELREPVTAMLRERYKRKPRKAENINALSRGGQVRSSVDDAVMVFERRDLATQQWINGQLVNRRNH